MNTLKKTDNDRGMSKTNLSRPKAYSYLRFSTPDQMRGDSRRRQWQRTIQYAEQHGLDLDETLTFHDLGTSAYRGKNAEEGRLGEFIRAVDEGRVKKGSYLLVENLDRLSRQDPYTAFNQFSAILKKGIHIVTVGDGQVFSAERMDFSALMLAVVGMQRAHEESRTKSQRLSAAWEGKRQKAQEGEVKFTSRCPAWLELDKATQTFKQVSERVEVIRRIFQMLLDGHGKRSITRTLNGEGVPTFGRSQGWQDSYIQKISQNEAVIGVYQPHCMKDVDGKRQRVPIGDPIEDYFPAIIDKETFYKARRMSSSRVIPAGRAGEKFSNLFTGIAYCGQCGATMHFENKGKPPKGGTYLVCSAARRKVDGCKRHSWSYPKTQCHIILNLRELDFSELFPTVYERSQTMASQIEDEITVKEAELEKIRSRTDNLIDLLADNPDSPARKRKLEILEQEERDAEDRLKGLYADLERERDTLSNAEESYNKLSSAMSKYVRVEKEGSEKERLDARRRLHLLLKRVIERITLTPATGEEAESLHGIIEINFKGVDYRKMIMVHTGQNISDGYKAVGEEEAHNVSVVDAKWPPEDGGIIGTAALAEILGIA